MLLSSSPLSMGRILPWNGLSQRAVRVCIPEPMVRQEQVSGEKIVY